MPRISLELGGVDLAVRTAGAEGAAPVVLLHALGEQSSDWNAVIEALAPSHRVLAVDLRGHGASSWPGTYSLELMRDDIVRFLDVCQFASVALVGHSLGATVGFLLASGHPDRVSRLVLEEPGPPLPACPPREVPPKPDGALCFDWRVVAALMPQRNQPDPTWWAGLRRITAPTLLIGGGRTSHLPQDQLRDMAIEIPQATFITIDAGHHVHSQRPAEFLTAVLPFLDG